MIIDDEYFMHQALVQAQRAVYDDEVPIGAVVVYNQKIIAKDYNRVERLQDVTAHAEMLAISAAAQAVGGKYLTDCTLYITLEPCMMCSGAILHTRIRRIVFGAYDVKSSFSGYSTKFLQHTEIIGGVLEQKCKNILVEYFKSKRLVP